MLARTGTDEWYPYPERRLTRPPGRDIQMARLQISEIAIRVDCSCFALPSMDSNPTYFTAAQLSLFHALVQEPGLAAFDFLTNRHRSTPGLERLDDRQRSPGSGPGLSLVPAVAELYGARLHPSNAAGGLNVEVVVANAQFKEQPATFIRTVSDIIRFALLP